eukprot:6270218-Pyramimonas_sp.AAC.1
MDPAVRARAVVEGMMLLRFAVELAELQVSCGGVFVLEHPEGASSWKSAPMKRLWSLPGVQSIVFDMCRFGLCVDSSGELSKKPTRIISDDSEVVASLSSFRCMGDHPHHVLQGSAQTSKAQ